jgi:hypothetical protein
MRDVELATDVMGRIFGVRHDIGKNRKPCHRKLLDLDTSIRDDRWAVAFPGCSDRSQSELDGGGSKKERKGEIREASAPSLLDG